jgi:hypothetical protein
MRPRRRPLPQHPFEPEAAAAPVVPAPQRDDRKPVAEGRQQVLAAFARSRAQASPQPATPQPRPKRHAESSQPEMSEEACFGTPGVDTKLAEAHLRRVFRRVQRMAGQGA